jgi:tetratricopeptide (TPR) repeat protein
MRDLSGSRSRIADSLPAIIAFAISCALLVPTTALSQSATSSQQSAAEERPWSKAQTTVASTTADVQKGGIKGIQPHVADLEQALAQAKPAYEAARSGFKDRWYVLTNGPIEALSAITAGISQAGGRNIEAIENPYPIAAFFLATYYNEIGRPADAVRVSDALLALPEGGPDVDFGTYRAHFFGERATALVALKRLPEALAAYDTGLASHHPLSPSDRGHLLRGRGFALTELGRLDDAEQAYRDSLVAEPNNQRALAELGYIARLRAGHPATATQQTLKGQ